MRDYDPTLGRYLQADPLGLVDGASVHGYAHQNPMRYIDPRGEFAQAALCLGPQAVACAFGGAAIGLGLYLYYYGDDVAEVCEIAFPNIIFSRPSDDWRENGDSPPPGHNGEPDDDDPEPEDPFRPPWWPNDDQYTNPEEWVPKTIDPGSPEQNLPPSVDPVPTNTGGQKTLFAVRIIQIVQKTITGF